MKKKQLLAIAHKITTNTAVSPEEISVLRSFEQNGNPPKAMNLLKTLALPASLLLGFLFATFPEYFALISTALPE